MGTGKDLLNKTLIVQALRPMTEKWEHTKQKSFCIAKETIIGKKRQPTEHLPEGCCLEYKKN